MANRTATIYKKVKVAGVWRYCKPALGKNHKIKPGWVIVDGKEQEHREGSYYVQHYKGSRPIYQNCGPDPARAVDAADAREYYLEGAAKGIKVEDPGASSTKLPIAAAITHYLDQIRKEIKEDSPTGRRQATLELFAKTLAEFQNFTSRMYMQDITREDMLNFQLDLRASGLHDNTCGKKLRRLSQWYRAELGLPRGAGLVKLGDEFTVEPEPPEVFEKAEEEAFFAKCDEAEDLLFSVFKESGFRMGEVKHLIWDDVLFNKGELAVTAKKLGEHGFKFKAKTPKSYRRVRVSPKLMDRLRAYKATQDLGNAATGKVNSLQLVFPNRNGHPRCDMLLLCKEVGERAGLERDKCWLHKWRSSNATDWLRATKDVPTVAARLGHKRHSSITERYLAALNSEDQAAVAASLAR